MNIFKFKFFVFAFTLFMGFNSNAIQAQGKFKNSEKAKILKEKLMDQKNQVQTQVSSIEPAQVEAQIEAKFEEVMAMIEEVNANLHQKAEDYLANNCADVTHNESGKNVLIDFGSSPCVGSDGRTRSGSIELQYMGSERTPNEEITVSFNNYFTNGYGLNGTLKYKTIGRNSDNQLTFNINIANGILTQPTGETATFEANFIKTWVNGEDTDSNPLDDVFETTGSTSGSLFDGTQFSSQTTVPLKYKLACAMQGNIYSVSGTRSVEIGEDSYSISYGAGNCDKKAVVTINGVSQKITLW